MRLSTFLASTAAAAALASAAPSHAAYVFFEGNMAPTTNVQWFQFVVGGSGLVDVGITGYGVSGGSTIGGNNTSNSGGFDGALYVFDSVGNSMGADDYAGYTDVQWFTNLAPGTYYAALTETGYVPTFGMASMTPISASNPGSPYWAIEFDTVASAQALTDAPGAVPEPATWAMMIAGFGLVGASMRRRKVVSVSYA